MGVWDVPGMQWLAPAEMTGKPTAGLGVSKAHRSPWAARSGKSSYNEHLILCPLKNTISGNPVYFKGVEQTRLLSCVCSIYTVKE